MPTEAAAAHAALIQGLKDDGTLVDPAVEAAFRAVPRHHFLPGVPLADVYRDVAIPTKHAQGLPISSSSQPAIMALMLQQLAVQPGQRVLEIGAGTGFNAALLAHLVGPAGHVVTVDIDEDLVAGARQHLAAAGFSEVQIVRGDGGEGYGPGAPYDRIIVTASAWDVLPAWREQLAPGGRLVLPLATGTGPQKSVALDWADDHLESRSMIDCGFMPLRGAFAGPLQRLALGPAPGVTLALMGESPASAETIWAWLQAGAPGEPAGVHVPAGESWAEIDQWLSGLGLWLSLRLPGTCDLHVTGPAAAAGRLPCLFRFSAAEAACLTLGVLNATGLSLLALAPGEPAEGSARELLVHRFGQPAANLAAEVLAWHQAGRPAIEDLRLRVYPRQGASPAPAAAQAGPLRLAVSRPHNLLVFDWPNRED